MEMTASLTKRRNSVQLFFITALLAQILVDAMLLSDLPTPSFLVDLRALRKSIPDKTTHSSMIPSIHLPKHRVTFFPIQNFNNDKTKGSSQAETTLDHDANQVDVSFDVVEGEAAIGYLHTSVTRAREDAVPDQDDPVETFLAELDLDPSFCIPKLTGSNDNGHLSSSFSASSSSCSDLNIAKLVLGLNNHHVGSYYWARSAGSGSSMEAPGVKYGEKIAQENGKESHFTGTLRWEKEGGPMVCNSNDGKRSEWVNFLRVGDTVQLVPMSGQDVLMAVAEKSGSDNEIRPIRIFGISLEGRPMGSEPEVLCEWKCK
mmetsp:Transcript_33152/g.49399  ORF Transcript_33152/g.49399 Transcript_33152/m.49399 type:complete len:316 (-) Transcript_33152:120-1067(-)